MNPHEKLIRKLQEHSLLSKADIAGIKSLPIKKQVLAPDEDMVRQGESPTDSAIVLEGMVARYHTSQAGKRQYLSFHCVGDMPDAQSLFLDKMDHSVCAVGKAVVGLVPHNAMVTLFEHQPDIGFAIWRETLLDAAIFREAITNNSLRPLQMRIAHFFCEQYYRAHQGGLIKANTCRLPLTQTQLAESLASSLPSMSRALIKLRKTKTVEFKNGLLHVKDWNGLVRLGDFNPIYLHLKKPLKFKH